MGYIKTYLLLISFVIVASSSEEIFDDEFNALSKKVNNLFM